MRAWNCRSRTTRASYLSSSGALARVEGGERSIGYARGLDGWRVQLADRCAGDVTRMASHRIGRAAGAPRFETVCRWPGLCRPRLQMCRVGLLNPESGHRRDGHGPRHSQAADVLSATGGVPDSVPRGLSVRTLTWCLSPRMRSCCARRKFARRVARPGAKLNPGAVALGFWVIEAPIDAVVVTLAADFFAGHRQTTVKVTPFEYLSKGAADQGVRYQISCAARISTSRCRR